MSKQRELKFRAWDTVTKQMCYDASERIFGFHTFNEHPIMQFTGLHDKSGKEIYEGDVVRNGGFTCTVDFEAGAFQLVAVETSDEGCWDTLFDLCSQRRIEEVEVIGNIHEHSHLLLTP